MENDISKAKRIVELNTAKINDIAEEEIQGEYRTAFDKVKFAYIDLTASYDVEGFTDKTSSLLEKFNVVAKQFDEEYEL